MGYANPLRINVTIPTPTEAIKLKLLRLLPGENRHSPFDTRLLNEASSLGDALRQLNRIKGAEENIVAAHIHPLYDFTGTCA